MVLPDLDNVTSIAAVRADPPFPVPKPNIPKLATSNFSGTGNTLFGGFRWQRREVIPGVAVPKNCAPRARPRETENSARIRPRGRVPQSSGIATGVTLVADLAQIPHFRRLTWQRLRGDRQSALRFQFSVECRPPAPPRKAMLVRTGSSSSGWRQFQKHAPQKTHLSRFQNMPITTCVRRGEPALDGRYPTWEP
jgi:hypothetical protein